MQDNWCKAMADKIQGASNTNGTKLLHSLLREVYGTFSFPVASIRSKDDKPMLRDCKSILKCWREHFEEILNRPSQVEDEFIELTPCQPTKHEQWEVTMSTLNVISHVFFNGDRFHMSSSTDILKSG